MLCWLAIAIGLVVAVMVLAAAVMGGRKAGGPRVAEEEAPAGEEGVRYRKRKWILDSGSEAKFYRVLEEAVAEVFGAGKCRVMVQVPLCQLVEVEKVPGRSFSRRAHNQIDKKRVDYVVCEVGSLRPLVAAELDGASHDGAARRERDGFVDQVLAQAGVTLVRFDRRGKEWGIEEVVARVGEVVGGGRLKLM